MTLREYLDSHIGEVLRIACEKGTGFIYAGIVSPATEDEIAIMLREPEAGRLPVIDSFESFYGGEVIRIPGKASGHAWLPKELETPPFEDIPIEHYEEMAAWIATATIQVFKEAYLTAKTAPGILARDNARAEVEQCIRFFKSPRFAALLPHVDGNDLVKLLFKRMKEVESFEDYEDE